MEEITANSLCLVRREFLNLIEKAFFLQIDSLVTETQTESSKEAMNLSKEIFRRLKSSRNSFQGTTVEEIREEIQKAMFNEILQEIRKEEDPEARAALKQNLTLPGGVFLRTLEIVFNFNK